MQPQPTDTGMEMHDLHTHAEFMDREVRPRPATTGVDSLRRLARVFAENPTPILQELVDIAVETCGADSAGISLEEPGEQQFRWIAVAGSFAPFLQGTTPRFFSPCGTTLDRGVAQHYRVTQPYYDFLGITAREITDGILIPWSAENLRGTIWCVSHRSRTAFDAEDYRMLQSLADFAAIAIRQQVQQRLLVQQAEEASAAAMAHRLAHEINNPLQSLTNTVFLAAQGGKDANAYAEQASSDLAQLSTLVRKLLDLKIDSR